MPLKNPTQNPNLESDPFGERSPPHLRERLRILGSRILFEANDHRLLRLVNSAYAGLPHHRLSSTAPDLRIRLLLDARQPSRVEPSSLAMFNARGILGGATDRSNFAIVSPNDRSALVMVSPSMLRFPYHVRYELIEFAAFTLAARVQRLVPLHAACVGINGRGVLLMGPSGAGKSTVALHCLLEGLEFLSEDSVFVAPENMRASGVANFLHIGAGTLRWLGRSPEATAIRKSPVIRRRSGTQKFEIDTRREPFKLAKRPLKIVSIVFLTSENAGTRNLLKAVSEGALSSKLRALQAYGAGQPQWQTFGRNVLRLPAYELRRGRHPSDSVAALRSLLAMR